VTPPAVSHKKQPVPDEKHRHNLVTNLTQLLEQRDLYINFGSSARTQSILDCSSSREEMVKERLIELAALKRRSVRRGKRSQRITRDIYDWDSQSRPSDRHRIDFARPPAFSCFSEHRMKLSSRRRRI